MPNGSGRPTGGAPSGGPARRPSGPGGRPQRPAGRFAGRRNFSRRRVCRYCAEPKLTIDYKDAKALRPFLSERGKITPRRLSGACAKHQRQISTAVKRARVLAIIPFSTVSLDG